jgi:hypothetical protein
LAVWDVKVTEAEPEIEPEDGDFVMADGEDVNTDHPTVLERTTSLSNVPEQSLSENLQETPKTPPRTEDATKGAEADGPEEDELDALLAEAESAAPDDKPPAVTPHRTPPPDEDEFQDDLDALAEMEGMW